MSASILQRALPPIDLDLIDLDQETIPQHPAIRPLVGTVEPMGAVGTLVDPASFSSADFSTGLRVVDTKIGIDETDFNQVLRNGRGVVDIITILPGGHNLATVTREESEDPTSKEGQTALRVWAAPELESGALKPGFCCQVKVSGDNVPIAYSPDRKLWALGTDGIVGVYAIRGVGGDTKIQCIGSVSLAEGEGIKSLSFNTDGGTFEVKGDKGSQTGLAPTGDRRALRR